MNIVATGFCRLYLGRHSVDQVLVGCLLGIITANFFHYEMKPIIYETLINPKWNYAFFTSLIALNMISQVMMLFHYIENYVIIPQQWIEII